jgi:hypothetical protein
MTARTVQRKRSAEEKVAMAHDDLEEIEQEILDEIAQIDAKWQDIAADVETVAIRAEAADVRVLELRLLWVSTG